MEIVGALRCHLIIFVPPALSEARTAGTCLRFEVAEAPLQSCYMTADGGRCSQGFVQLQLHDRITGRALCLATTHLKAKEGAENDAVRVSQVRQLLQRLESCAAAASCEPSGPPAIVLTGDFNTTPDSDACQLLHGDTALALRSVWLTGSTAASAAGPTTQHAPSQPDAAAKPPPTACVAASVNSIDGCAADSHASVEEACVPEPRKLSPPGAEFSTWKFRSGGETRRTIDYVWYSPSLEPRARWRMPSVEEIGPGALPSAHYPSDHLAVCVELQWR